MSETKGDPPIVSVAILAILSLFGASFSDGQRLDSSASFFVCQNSETHPPLTPDYSAVTVQLSGNPSCYKNGDVYNVTIKLQEEYDTVLITGVFSAASVLSGFDKQINAYQHKLCTILHSYAKQRPITRVDFQWKAPPEEMGCVDFVATLTRRDLVSSKGERIFSICPLTDFTPESETSEVEEEGLVLRDNFERNDLNPSLWKDNYFSINAHCQPLFQGKFASFCHNMNSEGVGTLTTAPLNLATAEVLQFVLGHLLCNSSALQQDFSVAISYGLQNDFFDAECSTWEQFKVLSIPRGKTFVEKVIALPKDAQKEGICLRWRFQTSKFQCVGIDNVLVTSLANRTSTLHADFDPLRTSNWHSYPGGVITNGCHNSRGKALMFNSSGQSAKWASGRELDIASSSSAVQPDEILWKLDLDAVASGEKWDFLNATIENSCSTSSRYIVLQPAENFGPSVCSPNIDLSVAGTVRFRVEPWKIHKCSNDREGSEAAHVNGMINVWLERVDSDRKINLLRDYDLIKDVTTVSLPIPSEAQAKETRVCWQLLSSTPEENASPYSLDDVYFLTSLPSPIDYVLQLRINFACDDERHGKKISADVDEYHVVVQYSTDHGHQWNNMHTLCLPPACTGVQSSIQSALSSLDTSHPWERITLPIPYAAISNPLRFRFLQKGGAANGRWAIDDIHVSNCLSGCHGHGTCIDTDKCSCDEGYEGPWCQFPATPLPSVLRDGFEGVETLGSNFYKSTGMEISARCGRVTSGLAAVFNQAGPRQLITSDMNTIESSILRFGLKMNGPRRYHQHHCPGPDRPLESIYIHASCNGGVTWSFLHVIQPAVTDARTAELVQVKLPPEARDISCRFKVWQPHHSGTGKDVWAIDDFYLGPPLTDRLAREFVIDDKPSKDAFVGRHSFDKHCNRTKVMVLQPNEMEETYPVRIESFSILQIEVSINCAQSIQALNNNSVIVQYSTDGGNRWIDLAGSKRHASELNYWKRITLKLPPETWSDETRFRIAQTGRLPERGVLAVHYFYAGPDNCPELCRGNGRCTLSGCVCDAGFEQPDCIPSPPLPLLTPSPESFAINGGRFTDIDRDGCLVRGTNNFVFDSPGVRYLETKEIEYGAGASIFFLLRLGDCDSRLTSANVHVDVELSWNGGTEWSHLAEYRSPFHSHPRLIKIDIPSYGQENAPPYKIRFIQAGIHGQDRNTWAIAGLTSSTTAHVLTSSDIFSMEEPLEENKDFWILANDPDPKSSCLAFDSHCLAKIALYGMITKEVKLSQGDSILFDVVVPQLGNSNGAELIMLEYSANGGESWQLVRSGCLHTWANCPGTFQSSRVDYRSLESSYNNQESDRYHFSVSDEMAEKPVLLRWHHQAEGNGQHVVRGFKLKNLYIGSPCPSLCSGHGKCSKATCNCDFGYDGDDCSAATEKNKISAFYDTFPIDESYQSKDRPGAHWNRVVGGKVVPNYCQHSRNAVIFFGSEGPRLLQTVELDLRNLRMVQFTLGVTNVPIYKKNCRSTMEHIIDHLSYNSTLDFAFLVLDYSNDNGLTWSALESWPLTNDGEKRLGVVLPHIARTPSTILRWWQLTRPAFKDQSLFWYLDDVLVNINETNPITFEYEVDPKDDPLFPSASSSDVVGDGITNWLGWQGLVSREEPHPVDTQLQRNSKDYEAAAYAETWDMEISDPTFAQFQLVVPPEGQADDRAHVIFEYSTDMGKTWRLVEEECYFMGGFCERLHPASRYAIGKENNATRITVHLPRRAITRSTRFRWITDVNPERLAVPWGVGHVYVGGICPWMCSGHGTCHHGVCQCDPGFGNSDCVPIEPLPHYIVNHFDEDVDRRNYLLTGGGISGGCGILSSGMAAVFHQEGLRYFESTDLDLTSGSFAQITVKFHCWAETESFMSSSDPFNHRLLLQYSVNGGITWTLIQEIMHEEERNLHLIVVNLMRIPDLTNSTRFRLWQPTHSGEGWDTWAVDSFVVNSLTTPGTIIYSTFHDTNTPNQWFTWLGGHVELFCSLENALVFSGQFGEQQIFTADVIVTPETALQFELNVGCGNLHSIVDIPVRLEYSIDGGLQWEPLVDDHVIKENAYDRMPMQTPTIYYSSTSGQWRRETLSLAHLETTKPVRFRWTQGFINGTDKQTTPIWGIRNIIISPRCPEMCNGHGKCQPDGGCQCDEGYLGDACELIGASNPQEFHETFNSKVSDQPEWTRMIGAERIASTAVGLGSTLSVNQAGVRIIETRDLDLTHANFIQFYLDSTDSITTDSVLLLQHSQNGGIHWATFYVIHLNRAPFQELYQIPIPPRATTSATRLRWMQIGEQPDGLLGGWSIDEIYIGGEFYAKPYVEEDFTSEDVVKDNWLFISGGKIESSCHSPNPSFHFTSTESPMLAVTKDIRAQPLMHLQYEITTGCDLPNSCNRIRLEYSTNYGLTWTSIPEDCVPGDDVDCQAYSLHTELLSGATGRKSLITISLPLTHGVVRFRWTGNERPDYDWSLNFVYVGSACGDCNGRGRCWRGSCVCEADWKGPNCEYYYGSLLSSVRETFDNKWNEEIWSKVNGGSVSSICGTLDSGAALHFHEACDRFAETYDLDLRHIEVIHFHLRSGCGRGSTTHPSRVLFQYSMNGGVKWHTGLILALEKFAESRLVSYLVPEEARIPAVRLRFWQLLNKQMDDWAIDSFIFESTLNIVRSKKPVSLALIDSIAEEEKPTQAFQTTEIFSTTTETISDVVQQLDNFDVQLPDDPDDYHDDLLQQSHKRLSSVDILRLGIKIPKNEEDDIQQFQSDEPLEIAVLSKNLLDILAQKLWWRKTNSDYVGEHCKQRGRIMRGKSSATEESVLETADFSTDGLVGHLMSFDVIVGSCSSRPEQMDLSSHLRIPLRLEVSFDHGVTWSLFHSLKLRGKTGYTPQSPSVFVQLGKWKTYRYSLDHLSAVKYARFRWKQATSSFSSYWAIKNFNVQLREENRAPQLGLVPLMEDFKNANQLSSQWEYTSGGKVILPTERLGDGHALAFHGNGFKWLETANLDLTFGETVQSILQFQGAQKRWRDNDTLTNAVYLQCSPDEGVNWILMDEFDPRFYEQPVLTHSVIPSKCRHIQSTLRWWQSIAPDWDASRKSSSWLIDNVLVENSDVFFTGIQENFKDGKVRSEYWEFYPDGVVTKKLCGINDEKFALNFAPLESSRFSGITSRHIVVKDSYAAYFKIKTSCGKISCRFSNTTSGVRFELRRGYGIPNWTLVRPSCLPSQSSHMCDPRTHHWPSIYPFNWYESWQRVAIPLETSPTSNWWQFRWIAQRTKGEKINWSLRDVYIGKMCPFHCNNNGDCVSGRCHCDPGFEGPTCVPNKRLQASMLPLMDHFEDPQTSFLWESILGATVQVGCGSLLPQAHGKHLHFDGCSVRMATTVPLETKYLRRIAFVIRIGTPQQIPTCRIQLASSNSLDSLDKAVLLQYSFNGVDWRLIASHAIKNYIQPQRVMYSIPTFTNATTVRFRWWQPLHGGSSWDQWAIDNLEILA